MSLLRGLLKKDFGGLALVLAQRQASSKPTVAIVGGGPSGLATAHYLVTRKHHPAENITIFERQSRVGGRVWSYKASFPNDPNGYLLEHGAAHVLSYYSDLYELTQFHGLSDDLKTIETSKVVDPPFFNNLSGLLAALQAVFHSGFFDKIDDLNAFYEAESAGFRVVGHARERALSELSRTVDDVAEQYGLAAFFRLLCWMLCTVESDKVSIGLFLKFFPPRTLKKFLEAQLGAVLGFLPGLHKHLPWKIPSQYFRSGFDTLTSAISKDLSRRGVKFVVDCEVADISTSGPRPQLLTSSSQSQPPLEFDRLVLTSLWRRPDPVNAIGQPDFFPGLPADLLALLRSPAIANPAVVSIPFKVVSLSRRRLAVHSGDTAIGSAIGQLNKPYVVYNNLHPEDPVYTALCTVDMAKTKERSLQECQDAIRSFVEEHFYKHHRVDVQFSTRQQHYWCYFQPVISPDLFRSGFYEKIESFQGLNNVYYSNIYTTFNYCGRVVQYAKELVDRHPKLSSL